MLKVNSDCPSQGLFPISHIAMVKLPLEELPSVISGTADRYQIHDLVAPEPNFPTDWAIPAGASAFLNLRNEQISNKVIKLFI